MPCRGGGTSDEITVTSSGAWELIGDDKVFEPSAKSGENGDKVTFTVGVNPKSDGSAPGRFLVSVRR